ncbi:EthD family reductase [Rhizosaccharibacter radicis]|uniref:EthD family reductase n=1 Tax=Rhizosaccharibacter radicis TaxID=2782605 RepID=A0ABT1VTB1_9PROT|nr:EthD family reductase [Acetobacteraceae bacterium KSS12]
MGHLPEAAHDVAAVSLFVAYEGDASSRFDRTYYVEHHLPIVAAAFGDFGLLDLSALFPAVARRGTIALCECRFRDEAAIAAAFGSEAAAGVMADVPNFTDLQPRRFRVVPLEATRA